MTGPGPPGATGAERTPPAFEGLRRAGSVTELLFLYECATGGPTQLRPIASRLGLTVQATSHAFRTLVRRGLVEVRQGRYRPTVAGIAALHGTLARLGREIDGMLGRLPVVGTTRAIALAGLAAGEPVSLELVEGLLHARPGGAGPSRGRATAAAAAGALVEVAELEGIVPIVPAVISIRTLRSGELGDPGLPERLRRAIGSGTPLLGAHGLAAYHALRRAGAAPITRFAVAEAAREASRIGVPVLLLVLDDDLPYLLAEFSGPSPPPLEVRPLPGRRPAARATAPRATGARRGGREARSGPRPRRRPAPRAGATVPSPAPP